MDISEMSQVNPFFDRDGVSFFHFPMNEIAQRAAVFAESDFSVEFSL